MTNPRDLSPGELLRATREQGFKWWIERGVLAVMKPVVSGDRKRRCHVDRLWREVCSRGLAFEGFVELVLYSEGVTT